MQGTPLQVSPVYMLPRILFSPEGNNHPSGEHALPEEFNYKEKRQTRVLVVDDALDVLEMFRIMLSLSDYEVEVAPSASEALEKARAIQFDVVVSDIGMPEMNGYELAQRLRTMPGYAQVPLIAVTGFARINDRDMALQSGFNAHLAKPVNPTTLLDLIEKFTE